MWLLSVAPAGYDEVDEQVGQDNADTNMDTDDSKEGDKATDTSETKMDEEKKSSDDEKEEDRPKDYFTMCLVNGYGSQVLRNLTDDDTKLTLNSKYPSPYLLPCLCVVVCDHVVQCSSVFVFWCVPVCLSVCTF